MSKIKKAFVDYHLYIAWVIALMATLGSLYFSQILKLPPCVLCWYQRICMYPLVAILAVGIIRKDTKVPLYALPLTLVGLAVSFYHVLLYYHIIPESIAPCMLGVSCTTKFFEWFGFVTIPFLSFVGFILLNILLIISLRLKAKSI